MNRIKQVAFYLAILIAFAILFLLPLSMLHAQQTIAPFKTSQANSNLYVNFGSGTPYSTIAKTVTAACGMGAANVTVVLLPGANPADHINTQSGVCNGLKLVDYTAAPAQSYVGNGTIFVAVGGGGGCGGPCVTTFNGRAGAVTLNSGDVTSALGYTPIGTPYTVVDPAGGNVLSINGTFTPASPYGGILMNTSTGCFQDGWTYGNVPGGSDPAWSGCKHYSETSDFEDQGINEHRTIVTDCWTVGDCALYTYNHSDGGATAASDEGFHGQAYHVGQHFMYMTGTVNSGATAGSTQLSVTKTGFLRNTSNGSYIIDSSHVVASGATAGGNSFIGSTGIPEMPISGFTATVSPAYSIVSPNCVGGGLAQSNPGNVVHTGVCTVSSIQGTNAGGFVNSTVSTNKACIVGELPETVDISNVTMISGGAQTMTISYRKVHQNGSFYIFQGGLCGTHLLYDFPIANSTFHFGYAFNVFGARDSTHLIVGCSAFGGTSACPNPFRTPEGITNLVKVGTQVTAGGNFDQLFNRQATVTIAGCSDSALNGVVGPAYVTATGLSWTQTGGGTGCPTATISMPQTQTFKLYWGAEVVGFQTGNTVVQMATNNVPWTAGDTVVDYLHYTWQGNASFTDFELYNTAAVAFTEGHFDLFQGEGISNNFKPYRIVVATPCSNYIGCGGTNGAVSQFQIEGANGGFLREENSPIGGAPLLALGCADELANRCGDTTRQTLFIMQGSGDILAVGSWSLTGNFATVNFTNTLPGTETLILAGGQHITIAGLTTGSFLNGVWVTQSATATSATFAITHANASATEAGTLTVNGTHFQASTIVWNPDLLTLELPNVSANTLSVQSFKTPSVTLGGTNNTPGILGFNRDGSTDWAAQIDLCGRFGASDYLGITSGGAVDCNLLNNTNQPDGILGSGVLDAQLNARMNNLVVGLPYAQGLNSVVATCSGTCATSWQYRVVSVNAAGQEGAYDPYGIVFQGVSNALVLDVTHFNTLTCPTVLQQGYPGGTTYAVYASNNTTGLYYHIGACPLGTTVVDDGSFSVITNPPAYGANADIAAGRYIANTKGVFAFQASQIIPNPDVQLSNPSSGVISVDSTTVGDGLGMMKMAAAQFSGTGFPISSGTAANTDLNGHLTLNGSGLASYNFTSTGITTAPECQATDTSAPNAVQAATSTATLTLHGTAGDVVSYGCTGHN